MSMMGEPPPVTDDIRERPRRRTTWPIALATLGILTAAVLLGAHGAAKPPPLATSCATPAMALSDTSVRQGRAVLWAATGPAGMNYVLEIGVKALTPSGRPNTFTPVHDPGVTQGEQATRFLTMPASCKQNGQFGVSVDRGLTYAVRMFRINGTGTDVSAEVVATKRLEVTG